MRARHVLTVTADCAGAAGHGEIASRLVNRSSLHGLHERRERMNGMFGKVSCALLLTVVTGSLGACGTGTDGVASIGPDMYMIGRLGGAFDYSGSAVKARLYGEASEYCNKRGQIMTPMDSTSKDSGLATYASAEVQFRCVKREMS